MGRFSTDLTTDSLGQQDTIFKEDVFPKKVTSSSTDNTKEPKEKKETGLTTGQKWFALIGITAVCYYILYKAGSFK